MKRGWLCCLLCATLLIGAVPTVSAQESSDVRIADRPYYDAREYGLVTSVKNQGSYGTCWAHAAASVIETAMINRGIATKDTVDISETMLVYYQFNAEPTPIGGIAEDVRIETDGRGMLNNGGTPSDLNNILCAWAGVVDESTYPAVYDETITSIDRTLMYQNQAALVTDVGTVLARINDERIPETVRGMKEAIAAYGSIATSFYVTYNYYDSYYNFTTNGRYSPNSKGANHTIAIVGWDDDFDAFGNYTPPAKGAWLVKNSYGTSSGDAGCFWLSYYDATIAPRAWYCDVAPTTAYDNNYQYDGAFQGEEILPVPSGTTRLDAANVYEVQNEYEMLTAVQIPMAYSGMRCEISVYTDLQTDKPDSGRLALHTEIGEPATGRHTFVLPTQVPLTKGQRFSVMITYLTNEGQDPTVEYEWPGKALRGQSFCRTSNGDWVDMADTSLPGNLRIKAFTRNVSPFASQGDMDGDGTITTGDARLLLQYTVGMVTLTDEQAMAADVNSDGQINSADVRKLLSTIATVKKTPSLGVFFIWW